MQTLSSLLLFVSLLLGTTSTWAEEVQFPKLSQPIVDQSHLFSAKAIAWIESELYRLRQSGGPQIQVLTVDSLEGLNIEQYAIELMNREKIGDEKKDDGLLFIVAKSERKMRIEVGQGLEGLLPDVNCKRIIENIIKPYFRQNAFDTGLIEGLITITSQVAPDFKWTSAEGVARPPKRQERNIPDFFVFFIIVILYLIISSFGRRGPRYFGGGGFGGFGGGGGFSGGGGGSWGGGGGGFSGGGASGDW